MTPAFDVLLRLVPVAAAARALLFPFVLCSCLRCIPEVSAGVELDVTSLSSSDDLLDRGPDAHPVDLPLCRLLVVGRTVAVRRSDDVIVAVDIGIVAAVGYRPSTTASLFEFQKFYTYSVTN